MRGEIFLEVTGEVGLMAQRKKPVASFLENVLSPITFLLALWHGLCPHSFPFFHFFPSAFRPGNQRVSSKCHITDGNTTECVSEQLVQILVQTLVLVG